MCEICMTHTSKSAVAAEILPEYIMCVDCGSAHDEDFMQLLRVHYDGQCPCGHQIIPIKEVILCSSTELRAISSLGLIAYSR